MTERPRPYGPYLLLKSLGTGGTGDVFLARPQDETGQVPPLVVVKRLHGQLSGQGDFLKRFKHEAQLVVAIDSPHVARVYDVGRVGDSFYIALEYVAGWPLARIIKDLEAAGHRPSMASVAEIVGGALAGLHALHTATQPGSGAALGVVHRDIAPKNIMVGEDGLTRLIDLGLGKSNLQDWKTSTGVVMGTPGYMAPEQVMGEAVDTRTDTYAMGIVLWELLTLKRYIKRGPVPLMLRAQVQPEFVPPSHRHPGVPAALDRVAARALAPDPTHRFPSAEAFREALLEAVGVDDGPPAVSTLVGDLLWGELSRSKTEVTALLVNPQAEPAQFAVTAATPASFEVLAARPSDDGMPAAQLPPTALSPQPTPQDALAPPFVEMAPGRAYGTPTPMPYPGPMGSGPLPAPSGGVPPKVVAGLMLLTLALGIGVGAFLLKNRSATPISIPTTAVRTAPAPAAAPSAAATALDVSEPPAESTTPAEAPPPHRTPHRRSKASRPAKTSAPTAKTSAAPTALSLLKRVMAVRPRLVAGSKPAQSAGRLLSALQAEVSTPNPEPARIQQLARQVRALEKAAP